MKILKPLVLASKSPRRIRLFEQIGLKPSVVPSDIPEEFDLKKTAPENAKDLARMKAIEVSRQFPDAFVVGADTIVVLDGALIAKPEDSKDAARMLRLLSGRTHTVITGFSIVDSSSGECVSDFETTEVTFRPLPEEEIESYVATGSPLDKAGAYGIQDDYGAVFVTRINGCFYNVVGFPLSKFYITLQQFQTQMMGRNAYVKKN